MTRPESDPIPLAHLVGGDDRSGLFRELVRRHDRSRFRVEVMSLGVLDPEFAAELTEMDVPTFEAGATTRLEWPGAMLRLKNRLEARDIRILHTHLFEPSVVGLAAGALAGVPVRVLTRHYSDYHLRLDRHWPVALDRFCTRLSHGVVAVSEHTRRVMIEGEGAPPEKVRVVHNGIFEERIRPPDPDAVAACREELHSSDRSDPSDDLVPAGMRPAILVPARLHPEKGHEHLFRALVMLKQRLRAGRTDGEDHEGPLPRIFLAGSGVAEASYRRMVDELEIEDDVVFLGHRRDVPALMAAADLVVLPSVAEAFGLVALEARGVGAPLIATTAGGLPEVVEHGRDGILVPPADPGALADALARMMDPAYREGFAKPDPGVADRFSFDAMVRGYESYYEELLDDRHDDGFREALGEDAHVG